MNGEPDLPFRIHCNAGAAGSLSAATERLSVTIGQRIVRWGSVQIWDGLLILANQQGDGTLLTRVLLCNPAWDEPVEIAAIESNVETTEIRVPRSCCAVG